MRSSETTSVRCRTKMHGNRGQPFGERRRIPRHTLVSRFSYLVFLAQVPEKDVPRGGVGDVVVSHGAPGEAHQVRLQPPRPQPLYQPPDAGGVLHRHLRARVRAGGGGNIQQGGGVSEDLQKPGWDDRGPPAHALDTTKAEDTRWRRGGEETAFSIRKYE